MISPVSKFSKIFAVSALFLIGLGACNQREQPIYTVSARPVPQASQSLSPDQLRLKFVTAIEQAGWVVHDDVPGRLAAEMRWRTHAAMVTVAYSSTTFSIDYRNSENLLVGRVPQGMIHRQYNNRVRRLEDAITQALLRRTP